jgi:hypothetical protein
MEVLLSPISSEVFFELCFSCFLIGGKPALMLSMSAISPIKLSSTISLRSVLTYASSNSKLSQWCSYSTVSACSTCVSLLSRVSCQSSSLNFSFPLTLVGNIKSELGKLPQKAEDHLNTSCLTIWKSLSVSTEFISTLVYNLLILVLQGMGSPVIPYGLNFMRLSLSASK